MPGLDRQLPCRLQVLLGEGRPLLGLSSLRSSETGMCS